MHKANYVVPRSVSILAFYGLTASLLGSWWLIATEGDASRVGGTGSALFGSACMLAPVVAVLLVLTLTLVSRLQVQFAIPFLPNDRGVSVVVLAFIGHMQFGRALTMFVPSIVSAFSLNRSTGERNAFNLICIVTLALIAFGVARRRREAWRGTTATAPLPLA